MEIDKIATLRLEPNDILVLNYGGKCSDNLYAHLNEVLERFVPGHKALILEQGITLQVLKPALKWTSDLPTQEGWYWNKQFNSESELYYVKEYGDKFVVRYDNDDYESCERTGGEWYGPIEPPEYEKKENL